MSRLSRKKLENIKKTPQIIQTKNTTWNKIKKLEQNEIDPQAVLEMF